MNGLLTLHTARLKLDPLGAGDLAWFLDLNRAPEVRRHLWDGRLVGSDEAQAIIERSALAAILDCLWVARQAAERIGFYGLWSFFDEPQRRFST